MIHLFHLPLHFQIYNILDLGVGGGIELSNIINQLKKENYIFESAEANEIDESFIKQSKKLFESKNQIVIIHKSNWVDLPNANPTYNKTFDFAFLTGNSLTYIGGGTRE